MWETQYSREPFDFKLFFEKGIRKFWAVLLAGVFGALIVGGVYSFIMFVINDGYQYRARTIYYVTYAEDEAGKELEYYNYYTWNEIVHTDYFTEGVAEELGRDSYMIGDHFSAKVESDYRYLYSYSTTNDPQESIDMEKALAKYILTLPEMRKEIESIEVVDAPGYDSVEDISLIFVVRAFAFGAVIGIIALIVFAVFYECVDTSFYIPSTLEKRYKIPCLGAPSMKEFKDNCRYYSEGKKKIGFIAVDEKSPMVNRELFGDAEKAEFGNLFTGEADYEKIRECDALFVIVKAEAHNGTKVDRLVEQLSRQNINVTAFILAGENRHLIRGYYK